MSDEFEKIKNQIQNYLISSGKHDIINSHIKHLLHESGWFDKMTLMINQELKNNDELNNDKFKKIYNHIKPKAQELVSENIKESVISKIEKSLAEILN